MTSSQSNGRSALQGVTLFVAMLATVAIIYIDLLVLGNTLREESLVQISQALLILGSGVFFALGARDNPEQRGYLLLVATLYLCMFVRENDGPLDVIVHGFWRVPVLIIAVVGGYAVYKNRQTLRAPFSHHAKDSSFWIMIVGFLQLIVFSRLFGSGNLWDNIPNQLDLSGAKDIIQEGIELMSYSLIFHGSYFSHKYRFGAE